MALSFRVRVEESFGASLCVLGGLVVEKAMTEHLSLCPGHCKGVRHARIDHNFDIRRAS